MNVARTLITAVFGSLIAYYVATIFTTGLITGTTTADNLITNLVPREIWAAFRQLKGNNAAKRGSLKPNGHGNPVLNLCRWYRSCVETRYSTPHWGEGIVQA